jgi:hypothetical protein
VKETVEELKEVGLRVEPEAKSAASNRSNNSKVSVAKSLKSIRSGNS